MADGFVFMLGALGAIAAALAFVWLIVWIVAYIDLWREEQ